MAISSTKRNDSDLGAQPVFHDGTPTTPKTSPTAGAEDLIAPAGAIRFWVKVAGTVGTKTSAGVAKSGTALLATTDGYVPFDCAGMNSDNTNFPTKFAVSAACNFYFDCKTVDGGAN